MYAGVNVDDDAAAADEAGPSCGADVGVVVNVDVAEEAGAVAGVAAAAAVAAVASSTILPTPFVVVEVGATDAIKDAGGDAIVAVEPTGRPSGARPTAMSVRAAGMEAGIGGGGGSSVYMACGGCDDATLLV